MTWTGVLKGGPLDGSDGLVHHPPRPPKELWPLRCPGPDSCPLAALVPEALDECRPGEIHWCARRHPNLTGHQHPYERVGADRFNRHVYEYPKPYTGIAPGTAAMRVPTLLIDPGKEPSTLQARFEANVDRSPGHGPYGECHVWTGRTVKSRTPGGYGVIWVRSTEYGGARLRMATHVAWLLEHGDWPPDNALHRCDHPPCVRIDHLFNGTAADNAADRDRKGRHRCASPIGSANGHAKMTEKLIVELRREYAAGGITQAALAKRVGVHPSALSRAIRRETWSHSA